MLSSLIFSHVLLCKIRNPVDCLQVIQSEINVVLKSSSPPTSCLLTQVSPLSVSLYIFYLLLCVQAHVYLTLPFIRILGLLLCDWKKKKISFQCKRAISQDVQVLRMRKGKETGGNMNEYKIHVALRFHSNIKRVQRSSELLAQK